MASNSKTTGRRAKRSGIWVSWILVTHIWGTYDLVVFKGILESFGAFVSKWPVSRKWLVIEQNGVKFGTRIWGTLYLVRFKVKLWGHSVHFSQNGSRAKGSQHLWLRGTGNTYMGCIWPLNVQGHFGSFRALVSKRSVTTKIINN